MIKYIALVALLCLSSSKTFASFIYADDFKLGARTADLTKDHTLSKPSMDATKNLVQVSEAFPGKGFIEPTHSDAQMDNNVTDLAFGLEGDLVSGSPHKVPTPSSLILLGIGILCVVKVRRSISKIQ